MSPEVIGNPPSVTKRKKNRDKKPLPMSNSNTFDLNMSSCNYFPVNPHHCPNLNFPDVNSYYPYVNCPNPAEPLSLPVYPMNYPNYASYPSSFMGSLNMSKHASLPLNNFNLNPDIGEYMSLPVVHPDQLEEINRKRRFSDPGLPNESDSSTNSFEDKIIHKLTQQINSLKENNRKLSREVMEMRIEINMLKQQQNSRHFERDYEPGMLADIIREVRDAARVREDALLARVKHIIEEKQICVNHMHLMSDKNTNNDRISKLEDQLKNISINNSRSDESSAIQSSSVISVEDSTNAARQVLELEREALELRRELQDTRAKKEEADQKILQLDKKLSYMMKRNDAVSTSDNSEDGKASIDSLSTVTTSSSITQAPRVILSGPVTDL